MARFFTSAWLVRHAVALILTVGFAGLGWWQLDRATGGNGLSWAYTFEWPVFAIFVLALWIREVRAELRESGGVKAVAVEPPMSSPFPTKLEPAPGDQTTGDSETDSYNRYLAWMSANPDRRPSEYPG